MGEQITMSYENIKEVPFDKLIKLRDVAKDNMSDLMVEAEQARQRFIDLQLEIQQRELVGRS